MALLPALCLPPRGAPPLREKNAGDPPPSWALPSSRRSSGRSLSHAIERRGFPQLHDTRRTAPLNAAGTTAPDIPTAADERRWTRIMPARLVHWSERDLSPT